MKELKKKWELRRSNSEGFMKQLISKLQLIFSHKAANNSLRLFCKICFAAILEYE